MSCGNPNPARVPACTGDVAVALSSSTFPFPRRASGLAGFDFQPQISMGCPVLEQLSLQGAARLHVRHSPGLGDPETLQPPCPERLPSPKGPPHRTSGIFGWGHPTRCCPGLQTPPSRSEQCQPGSGLFPCWGPLSALSASSRGSSHLAGTSWIHSLNLCMADLWQPQRRRSLTNQEQHPLIWSLKFEHFISCQEILQIELHTEIVC